MGLVEGGEEDGRIGLALRRAYQRDVTQALRDLQRKLVASGDYYHGVNPDELDPEERERGGHTTCGVGVAFARKPR